MANYIYNGVELPQLPEWDKDTYPYALIGRKETDNSVVFCASSAKKVAWENGTVSLLSGIMYIPNNDVWEQIEFDGCNAYPFWTNTDINYQADGTLYLAASDPLPVGKPITDPLSFVMGCQLGCRLRAQRAVKKPIGYLYNGVFLPDINTVWTDKETYPYAAVINSFGDGNIGLVFSTAPMHRGKYLGLSVQGGATAIGYKAIDGAWEYFYTWQPTVDSSYTNWAKGAIWANYDILNEDGTTYLVASDPIPAYE